MFAVIFLPQFALQAALRHEPELWAQPVALVDPARSTPVVCDFTEAAQHRGITSGLTPTQALARCRDILIRRRAPDREDAATEVLLQCAFGFSPNIESTAPGVCTLELRGLSALLPPSQERTTSWAKQLRTALAAAGLRARVGVATTPNLARQAARWGEPVMVIEEARTFIATLPVTALEPSSDVSTILAGWGIHTVGELLALGQAALVERLGLEALALCAAASTTHTRPLRLAQPSDVFEESFEFEHPVETSEPLLFLVRRFVDQLGPRLALTGLVAATVALRIKLESGQALERTLRVPRPTAQPDILFRMIRTHIENLRAPSPIAAVSLEACPCPREQRQLGLFETALRDPQRFQETLARLTALLGADRVGSPVLEDSHRPDAFTLLPPDFENAPAVHQSTPTMRDTTFPLRRLRPGIRAGVEADTSPDGPRPASLRCTMAEGRLRISIGPWRSSGHWWEAGAWQREEWDVETTRGTALRLNRNADGWSVEGILD